MSNNSNILQYVLTFVSLILKVTQMNFQGRVCNYNANKSKIAHIFKDMLDIPEERQSHQIWTMTEKLSYLHEVMAKYILPCICTYFANLGHKFDRFVPYV